MPDDKTTSISPDVTTTGRVDSGGTGAQHDREAATPQAQPVTSTGTANATNPGPHNPDLHGPEHGATHDTEAQKLENEAASGQENRY